MVPKDISAMIARYGLVSEQVDAHELAVVLAELDHALSHRGAVVEFGCYVGTTSLYIRRLLELRGDDREFHAYDSFEGLPAKLPQDHSPLGVQFRQGELAVSKKRFLQEFRKARLAPPIMHKAWFHELTPDDTPAEIAFAFLDGDYYESIKSPLELITPRLVSGAVLVVDDYANDALPGAARAVDEWCAARGYRVRTIRSLAVVVLP